jgi:hypothetical protein
LARDKPWVVFSSESTLDSPYGLTELITSKSFDQVHRANYLHHRELYSELYEAMDLIELFNPKHVGHGLTQVSFENKSPDIPFKAMMSSVKASIARIAQFDKDTEPIQTADGIQVALALPVIAIDGNLFECRLTNDGHSLLEQTDISVVRWKGVSLRHAQPYVYIVTSDAMSRFAALAQEASQRLMAKTLPLLSLVQNQAALSSTNSDAQKAH